MRICLFVGTALPRIGGAEMVVDKLASQWAKAGMDVTLLAPRPTFFGKLSDDQMPYRVLRHPPIYSSRHGVEWYGRYLRAAHETHRFQVVHCHGIFPHGYLAARLKPQLGIPLVFTSHGGDVGPDDRRYSKPIVREKMLWAMSQLDAMISIGPFTRRGFQRICPTTIPIVDIPNGVEAGEFSLAVDRPIDLPATLSTRQFLLFLGRLSNRKGVDLLLNALERIRIDRQVNLVIAGDGNERQRLQSLSADLPTNCHVHFLGSVEGAKKTWLLQNALCTVMPSRGWEAFPLVMLESFAAGTPVVASDADGLGELVRSSRAGLTFPMDSANELARTLTACLVDPMALESLGRTGRAYANSHDWSVIANQHLQLFETLRNGRDLGQCNLSNDSVALNKRHAA